MIPASTLSKYLRKKPVQEGIVAEVTKELIQRMCKTQDDFECSYKQWSIYIKNANQELRTTIFLQRTYIISRAEQKINETFHLHYSIKDIKFQ